jgi:hypothetical protein
MRGLPAHLFAPSPTVLQVEDPLAGAQPRLEFLRMERLAVVSARLQPGNDVLFLLFGCEQHQVNVGLLLFFLKLPHFPANTRSVEFRHHPIEIYLDRVTGGWFRESGLYTFLVFQVHGPLYCSSQRLDLYLESF